MTQAELLEKLREIKPELHALFGIEQFALFGSYARNEADENSDVDIAILKMQLKSGFDVIRAKEYLKERLRVEVDMGTYNAMNMFIKNRIRKDLIYV